MLHWVKSPAGWDLGYVRASLTVSISVLTMGGIWILAYCRWKYQAPRVSANSAVPLLSLFAIANLGDVWDAIWITKFKNRGLKRNWSLIVHCILVTFLTVVGLLSGPIAKWTTHIGHIAINSSHNGTIASPWTRNASFNMFPRWTERIRSLNQAGFPYDQLLDYLPDTKRSWKYNAEQWHPSWKMSCAITPNTSFEGVLSGEGNGTDVLVTMPALAGTLPSDFRNIPGRLLSIFSPYQEGDGVIKFAQLYVALIDATDMHALASGSVRVLLYTYGFEHMPMTQVPFPPPTTFEPPAGPVGNSIYSGVDCHLELQPGRDYSQVTGPPLDGGFAFLSALQGYLYTPFMEQAMINSTTLIPTPEELIRYFQVWTVTKDTYLKDSSPRQLLSLFDCVEVSIYLLVAMAVFLGSLVFILLRNIFTSLLSRSRSRTYVQLPQPDGSRPIIPRTKLEWLLWALREAEGRDISPLWYTARWRAMEDEAENLVFGNVTDRVGHSHIGIGRVGTERELGRMQFETKDASRHSSRTYQTQDSWSRIYPEQSYP